MSVAGPPKKSGQRCTLPLGFEAIHDRRIAGQKRGHFDPERREGTGQRTDHIGEPAGLDQRKGFRRDRQDAWFAHAAARCCKIIDHRRGDEADATLGTGEALRVELRILADHQAVRNAHPAIDYHILQAHVLPDLGIG